MPRILCCVQGLVLLRVTYIMYIPPLLHVVELLILLQFMFTLLTYK